MDISDGVWLSPDPRCRLRDASMPGPFVERAAPPALDGATDPLVCCVGRSRERAPAPPMPRGTANVSWPWAVCVLTLAEPPVPTLTAAADAASSWARP